MKRLKKVITGLLCSSILLAGGSACGKERVENEILFYMWGTAQDYEIVLRIAEGFEKVYADYKVKVENHNNDYDRDLLLSFNGDEKDIPDVFFVRSGNVASMIREGLVADIQQEVESGAYFNESSLWEINDYYRFDGTKMGQGNLYAIIKDFTPEWTVIYNKDFIDEYNSEHDISLAEKVGYPTDSQGIYPSMEKPMTWAQIEKFCHELSVMNAKNPNSFDRYGCLLDHALNEMPMEWVQQLGGSMYDENGMFKADDENVKKAFQHLYNFVYGENRSTIAPKSNSVSGGEQFYNGQVAVLFNGRYAFAEYDLYSVDFEIGVAPPPVPYENSEIYCGTAMNGLAVSSFCSNKEAAYKFIEYYMTYGMSEFVNIGFNIPGNKAIAADAYCNVTDAYQKELNRYYVSLAEKTHWLNYNRFVDKSRVDTAMNTALGKVWTVDEKNRITMDEALREIREGIEKYIVN